MSPSLSIVVPAYNEEACIGASLVEIMRFARASSGGAEIIVVDDGSTDATAEIVAEARDREGGEDPPLQLVRHAGNRGKGASVRTGFEHARGAVVMFTDADLSAPIAEASRLIEPIVDGSYDVTVGSRALDRSLIGTHQSVFRENAGKLFNRVVRALTGLTIHDTQCGFKAFRREAIAPAFTMQRLDGFAFDVELLYLATRKLHLRVLEVPVRWNHVAGTSVSMVRDGPGAVLDLCRIRWNDLSGRYREQGVGSQGAGQNGR